MKTKNIFLLGLVLFLSSCAIYTDDNLTVETEPSVNIVIRYGTPYYYMRRYPYYARRYPYYNRMPIYHHRPHNGSFNHGYAPNNKPNWHHHNNRQ